MGNIFLSFLFLFNFSSNDYDYKLLDFYDGEIKEEHEMLDLLNLKREDLDFYKCDNPIRYQLFTDFKYSNPNADSLKVEGKDKKIYTYKDGSLYKGNKKYKIKRSQTYLRTVMSSLKKLNSTHHGSILLDKITKSHEKIIIARGRNSFMPNYFKKDRYQMRMDEATFAMVFDLKEPRFPGKVPFQKPGTGGYLYWNPGAKSTSIEEDYVARVNDPTIVLAHEMYHAYDSIRGLLDRRFVDGDDLQSIGVLEYRASYLENLVRKELGLKYRRYYSDVKDFNSPDILNEDGSPILLPSPCITWL